MNRQNKVHFFKAHSGLGLINLPWGGTEFNSGVELGPDYVLSPDFISKFFPNSEIDAFTFPNPQKIDKTQYKKILSESSLQFTNLVNEKLEEDEMQVVIGGDHSIAFASVLALLNRSGDPNKIGYIQFDSHADVCCFSDTPSGNFHGMFARALMDKNFDSFEINSVMRNKLNPKNVIYIGNLEKIPVGKNYLEVESIRNITRDEILRNKEIVENEIKAFIESHEILHTSFDIDVFNQDLVKATGTLSSNGLYKEDVYPFLELISRHPKLSIDLVEVNPTKEGSKETIEVAQEVLRKLLAN